MAKALDIVRRGSIPSAYVIRTISFSMAWSAAGVESVVIRKVSGFFYLVLPWQIGRWPYSRMRLLCPNSWCKRSRRRPRQQSAPRVASVPWQKWRVWARSEGNFDQIFFIAAFWKVGNPTSMLWFWICVCSCPLLWFFDILFVWFFGLVFRWFFWLLDFGFAAWLSWLPRFVLLWFSGFRQVCFPRNPPPFFLERFWGVYCEYHYHHHTCTESHWVVWGNYGMLTYWLYASHQSNNKGPIVRFWQGSLMNLQLFVGPIDTSNSFDGSRGETKCAKAFASQQVLWSQLWRICHPMQWIGARRTSSSLGSASHIKTTFSVCEPLFSWRKTHASRRHSLHLWFDGLIAGVFLSTKHCYHCCWIGQNLRRLGANKSYTAAIDAFCTKCGIKTLACKDSIGISRGTWEYGYVKIFTKIELQFTCHDCKTLVGAYHTIRYNIHNILELRNVYNPILRPLFSTGTGLPEFAVKEAAGAYSSLLKSHPAIDNSGPIPSMEPWICKNDNLKVLKVISMQTSGVIEVHEVFNDIHIVQYRYIVCIYM